MEKKTQLMIGSGALVGIAGLYFAWNFYKSKTEPSKKPESLKQPDNIEMVVTEKDEKKEK